jgi:tetratricopeptide (TPR) repeat protein
MLEFFSRWLRRYQGIEASPIYRLAVDVATGRTSFERALDAAQSHQVIGRLADGDLFDLDHQVEYEAGTNLEFALVLARLNAAAARAKGFDRVLVDLCLRVADLLERPGQEKERDYYLREALLTAQRISYIAGQRKALNRLARGALERDEVEMARDLLAQQLDAGREDTDTREEIETAIMLAEIAIRDDDATKAHDLYHRAARSSRRIGHYRGSVEALRRQAELVRERGDLQGALMLLQEAEECANHTFDADLQASVSFDTGTLLAELDRPAEAATHLLSALERARGLGDLSLETRCLSLLSRIEQQLGQDEHSLQHYDDLITLERRLGNRLEVARSLAAMGEIYLNDERFDEALRVLGEARDIAAQAGEIELSYQTNGLLGRALTRLGREREALDALSIAISTARAAGDTAAEATWLVATGEAMLRFRDPADAAVLAERAEELARATRDNILRAGVYNLTGQIALVEQRLPDARDAFASAAAAARAAGDRLEALRYLPLLGRLAAEDGDLTAATRHFDQAIELANALGERARACAYEGQVARLFQANGDLEMAAVRYERALAIAEELGDSRLIARALQGLATTYDADGRVTEAITYYRRALEAATVAGDMRSVAAIHYNLGALLVDEQRDDEARAHLTRARDTAATLGNAALADQARDLLSILTPPSPGYDIEYSDQPLHEGPARPRDFYYNRDRPYG